MQNFFTTSDPLDSIIATTLKGYKIISTRHIISGWTNIVIEVTTDRDSFFFRFPRNPFWSKMIVKDAKFCNFVEGKTSFYTPSMQLRFADGRPFSVHTKIKGYSMNDRMYHLSHTTITAAAYSIAKFIKELGNIDTSTAPADVKYPLSDFLRELDDRHYDTHLHEDHAYIKNSEKSPVFVHGDLNPGNILLNDRDEVIGIVDFCFAGISHPYMDVSRIISRPTPSPFETEFLAAYKKLDSDHLDTRQVNKMRAIWGHIDQGYINHMKHAHPEIILPEGM